MMHSGFDWGYQAMATYFPETDTTFVLEVDASAISGEEDTERVVERVLGSVFARP